MARRKPVQDTTNKPDIPVGRYFLAEDAPWRGFLNIRLQEDDREVFANWLENYPDEPTRIFHDLLGDGAKVGFSYDSSNQCFITTLTGALLEGDTGRYVMTTRGGTWAESLALCCWKHSELAHGDYGDFLPRTGTFKSWG